VLIERWYASLALWHATCIRREIVEPSRVTGWQIFVSEKREHRNMRTTWTIVGAILLLGSVPVMGQQVQPEAQPEVRRVHLVGTVRSVGNSVAAAAQDLVSAAIVPWAKRAKAAGGCVAAPVRDSAPAVNVPWAKRGEVAANGVAARARDLAPAANAPLASRDRVVGSNSVTAAEVAAAGATVPAEVWAAAWVAPAADNG
jgi:hypothetical protein